MRPARLALASLALIGTVVLIATIGLGFDGNWPKVLRVLLSFATYAAVVAVWAASPSGARTDQLTPSSLGAFVFAGGVAGVVSGLVRPEIDPLLVIVQASTAPLLGFVHWLSLRVLQTRVQA